MTMKVRKAVFPAAGLGTRFLPATKAQPKEMLPLVDKPIIQYGVEEAMASGCDQILIVTGRGKQSIEDHFDVSYELEKMLEERGRHDLLKIVRSISDMMHVAYVRQKEALGLGHAVLMARELGDTTVADKLKAAADRESDPRFFGKQNEMFGWWTQGKLKPLISARYDLAEAKTALQEIAERKATGKIVLTTGHA